MTALSIKNKFFSRGIHALPKRWNTCTERNGDYVEKCHCVPCVFNKLRDKIYLRFSFDSPSYLRDLHEITGFSTQCAYTPLFSAT